MIRLICFVLLFCLSTACTSVLVGGSATSASDGRSGAEYQNDARINAAVKTALIHDGLVDSTSIRVNTIRGVVTLSGSQASDAQIQRAISGARSTAGVRAVVSHLTTHK